MVELNKVNDEYLPWENVRARGDRVPDDACMTPGMLWGKTCTMPDVEAWRDAWHDLRDYLETAFRQMQQDQAQLNPEFFSDVYEDVGEVLDEGLEADEFADMIVDPSFIQLAVQKYATVQARGLLAYGNTWYLFQNSGIDIPTYVRGAIFEGEYQNIEIPDVYSKTTALTSPKFPWVLFLGVGGAAVGYLYLRTRI